jgi:2,4-dienoyl-CoA reductase-like NADH-dependent reductase (Old Yellow Enzyme family)
MTAVRFKRIFEPANIGRMRLKNRIVMPPMGTNYAEAGGAVSQRMLDYYEARARGGTGLIIVEGSAPSLQCSYSLQASLSHQASMGDDKFIPGWRKLTDATHKYGAKIAIQIMHSHPGELGRKGSAGRSKSGNSACQAYGYLGRTSS